MATKEQVHANRPAVELDSDRPTQTDAEGDEGSVGQSTAEPARGLIAARRPLRPQLAFGLAAAIVGLCLFAAATPSPLYADYATRWHFSTVVLTSVYAVYAIGVLAALLLTGGLSDEVGRRSVLVASLVGLLGATGVFMAASSVGWLFAARGLQGLATGCALGAAAAALLDFSPGRDARHAGFVNGVAASIGIATGALVSSILVQLAPVPRLTPFVVLFVLLAAALAGTLGLPEPVSRRAHPRLRAQRPKVPPGVRAPFVLSSVGVVASWSIGGVYLALAPSLAAQLLHTHSHLAGGGVLFAFFGAGGVAQLIVRGLTPRPALAGGSLALAAGMAMTVGALSTASSPTFLVASVVAGAGFGVSFMGSLRLVSTAAPDNERAAVLSAFFVVAYLSLSVPAIAAGLLVPSLGLKATFEIFGAAVVALALGTALGTLSLRQSRKDGPVADDNALDSHLVAVFDELIELVQEIKQLEWTAPSASRRLALEQLKELLGQQAVAVSDAEQRIGGPSPSIMSPSAHRPRNLSAEAGGDTTRLRVLLVTDLAAVAEDLRQRSATTGGEWQHTFQELANGLEDHIAALREW